jgi:hypothetical protein
MADDLWRVLVRPAHPEPKAKQSASFTIAQSRRALLFQQVTWKSPIFFERDLLNT